MADLARNDESGRPAPVQPGRITLMEPNRPETQVLLDQARRGDAAAVEQLLARHREPVRRMINLRLDPAIAARLDASDVVQDVLVEASRRLNYYLPDPVLPFPLWLRHIARDHIIDAHPRHPQVPLPPSHPSQP